MPANNTNGNSAPQQWGAQFGFPTSGQVLPNSTDPSTGHASASSAGDYMAGTFVDPNGLVGGLYNDIMGYTSQEREFAHEEYMTEEYETAEARMRHAKNAGINPLTAAAGIVGSSGSASATGSATPSSAPIDAISKLGTLGSQNALNKATAAAQDSIARNADRLADASIFTDAANAASLLTSAGIPEIAAMELGLSFARNGLSGFSNAFNADGLCRRFDYDMDNIDAEINKRNAEFSEILSRIPVNASEADLNNVKKEREGYLAEMDKKKRDLIAQYDELAMQNGCLTEWAFMRKYGSQSPEVQQYMAFLKEKFYNQSIGSYNADMDTIFARKANELKGAFESEAEYKPYLDGLEILKNAYNEFFKANFQNPSSVRGAIVSLLNQIKNFMSVTGIQTGDVDRSKPSSNPRHSVQHPAF